MIDPARTAERHRTVMEEARALQELLRPFAGQWVALSGDWRRVIAADMDHHACLQKARAEARTDDMPRFYRVPG